MGAIIYFAVLAVLSAWAVFWIVRLAVRYGMNDAIRMNKDRWHREGPTIDG